MYIDKGFLEWVLCIICEMNWIEIKGGEVLLIIKLKIIFFLI